MPFAIHLKSTLIRDGRRVWGPYLYGVKSNCQYGFEWRCLGPIGGSSVSLLAARAAARAVAKDFGIPLIDDIYAGCVMTDAHIAACASVSLEHVPPVDSLATLDDQLKSGDTQ